MEYTHLSNTVSIKKLSEDGTKGVFEVEGLYGGYGLTLGNAMRRALLSSLPGAAVTQVKIRNVQHEFSTLPGIKEDIVELTLNFKKIRFRTAIESPRILTIRVKGIKVVTAGDLETDDEVGIVNPDVVLATLTAKNAEFDAEVTVERGLGYSAVESRKGDKPAIGVIMIDAYFSPVMRASYTIEKMRVGERTDYDRLRFELDTDGSVSPSAAFHKASNALRDHFAKIGMMEVSEIEMDSTESKSEKKKKKTKKASSTIQ